MADRHMSGIRADFADFDNGLGPRPELLQQFDEALAAHDAELLEEFAKHVKYVCPGESRMAPEGRCYCDVANMALDKAKELKG